MMFRVIPLLLCACAAEKMSVESHLAQARDELSLTSFTGKSRAGGLASGMKDLALRMLEEQVPDDRDAADVVFGYIIGNFSTILQSLLGDAQADQSDVNSAYDAFGACLHQQERDDIAAEEGIRNDLRTAHHDCRTDQSSQLDTMTQHCDLFQNYIDSILAHECPVPGAALTHFHAQANQDLTTWKSFLAVHKAEYQTAETTYAAKRDACKPAYDTYKATESSCRSDQIAFEEKACEVVNDIEARCIREEGCYDIAKAAYEGIRTSNEALSNQRAHDASQVEYVKCVVEAIRAHFKVEANAANDEIFTNAITACDAKKDANYDQYRNTFLDVPAELGCVNSTYHPGSPTWVDTEYGTHDHHDADAYITC